jgi:hypothetical protein
MLAAQSLAILLTAISMVETGGDKNAVGSRGERGEFAMIPSVVAQHGGYTRKDAESHAVLVQKRLVANKIDPNPFNIALAWNAGIGAVIRGNAPVKSYQYAVRVNNLYESITRGRKEGRPGHLRGQ